MTHICVSKLTSIGSDNGLSPGRRQAIIWTNAWILLIVPLGTNFSEILIKILTFSFTKMRLKVSSAKWRPFCLGLNVLKATFAMRWCGHWNYGSPAWISAVELLLAQISPLSLCRYCLDNLMVLCLISFDKWCAAISTINLDTAKHDLPVNRAIVVGRNKLPLAFRIYKVGMLCVVIIGCSHHLRQLFCMNIWDTSFLLHVFHCTS